jgi:hypothetical protein
MLVAVADGGGAEPILPAMRQAPAVIMPAKAYTLILILLTLRPLSWRRSHRRR